MVAELRGKIEIVPATHILKHFARKSVGIEHEGKSFRAAVNRTVDSEPPPPLEYGFD